MSNIPSDPNTAANTFATQPPPTHHIHQSSDVLPGARGGAPPAQDYSTDTTAGPRVWREHDVPDRNERMYGAGTDTRAVVAGEQHEAPASEARSAYTEERPLGVQPTEKGGVAIGGNPDLPEGHAKLPDKLIGKAQKLAGKMTSNAEMHEKGELRESGGKAAVQGQARAPHD